MQLNANTFSLSHLYSYLYLVLTEASLSQQLLSIYRSVERHSNGGRENQETTTNSP